MKKSNLKQQSKDPSKMRILIREVLFWIILAISALYFYALFNYHLTVEDIWSNKTLDQNIGGIFGVFISKYSFELFGIASYIVPISMVWLAFKIHLKSHQEISTNIVTIVIKTISFILFIIVSTCIVENIQLGLGGWFGENIQPLIYKLFGKTSLFVYFILLLIIFSVGTGTSVIQESKKIIKFIAKLLQKIYHYLVKKNASNIKLKNTKKIIMQDEFRKKAHIKKDTNMIKQDFDTNKIKKPPLSLLRASPIKNFGYSKEELDNISQQVELKLKEFNFDVKVQKIIVGPVVTQFELSLAAGIKASQISSLSTDLARSLLVESVRIAEVIPGKPTIGLEIPNAKRQIIYMKEILSSNAYQDSTSSLTMALGHDITGNPVISDLAKMPHLLIAGATGMGKSVGLNVIILSIIYKSSPAEVRLIMIDPKIVELSLYKGIPHLLSPVITDMNKAMNSLYWCVTEMERRYELMAKYEARNIDSFNQKVKLNKQNISDNENKLELLSLIVIVIDEYADLLGALKQEEGNKNKKAEALIIRLAQKARAAGIHLIIATQRPSVDVITGLIKSNIPTRISFKVSSKIDSRTVLDQSGAEQLLGQGDMLYMSTGKKSINKSSWSFY